MIINLLNKDNIKSLEQLREMKEQGQLPEDFLLLSSKEEREAEESIVDETDLIESYYETSM